MNHSLRFLILISCLIVSFVGCVRSPTTAIPSKVPIRDQTTISYWPTDDWRTSPPEEQGMDSQKLAQMLEEIDEQEINLHSLLVIRNGYIVSETYFNSYQKETRHELYSCTKSFISTLVGIALDQEYIEGIDQSVVDYFPEKTFKNMDDQKQAITIQDLLTMQPGFDWQEGDPIYQEMYQSPDWVKLVLDTSMISSPGTQFNYCSGCSHVLSAILQQTTGDTRDFAERILFHPLGITNIRWDADAQGIPIGGWGLQLTPRDMAKLGYLYLQDGQWAGQQIVSPEWVNEATYTHVDLEGVQGYGYQWWTFPSISAYMALGRYGQAIIVIPEHELVIVTTAALENHDPIFLLIEQYILPAVQETQ